MPRKKKTADEPLVLVNLTGGKVPECPLCLKPMVRAYDRTRFVFVFACHTDKIAIHIGDPFVNKWDQIYANIVKDGGKLTCVLCNADMRYFATSVGFVKMKCPKKKCGATVHTSEPNRRFDPRAGARAGAPRILH